MTRDAAQEETSAWARYWAGAASARGGGCLPNREGPVEMAQREAWRRVAANSPQGTEVLDLATGDGAVLRHLRALRPDLKLWGVDASPTLPPGPDGCEVMTGVAIENLPFANDKFGLVTSQFGFEYAQTGPAARELSRVLTSGGMAALLVHRGDGPVLKQNSARAEALRWALEELGLLNTARAELGASFTGAGLPGLRLNVLAAEAQKRFGARSPAWELVEATRRIFAAGNIADAAQALTVLHSRARDELRRIEALRRACAVADDRQALHDALFATGLLHVTTTSLSIGLDGAFGDMIVLRRA